MRTNICVIGMEVGLVESYGGGKRVNIFQQIPCVFPVWKNGLSNSLFSLCRGNPAYVSLINSMFGLSWTVNID